MQCIKEVRHVFWVVHKPNCSEQHLGNQQYMQLWPPVLQMQPNQTVRVEFVAFNWFMLLQPGLCSVLDVLQGYRKTVIMKQCSTLKQKEEFTGMLSLVSVYMEEPLARDKLWAMYSNRTLTWLCRPGMILFSSRLYCNTFEPKNNILFGQ